MGKEIVNFGNNEIEKKIFHSRKNPILVNDIHIDQMLVPNKVPFGKKGFNYFIGYKNNYEKFMPWWIMLPKMSVNRKNFKETKYMSFSIKENELLKKGNEIWEKASNTIKKGLDNEAVYNEKYLKSIMESYKGKINTNFHNHKIPKESSHCLCLSLTLIDSVFKIGKSYYPQVFLEECEYNFKGKKMFEYITYSLEFFSELSVVTIITDTWDSRKNQMTH